jgi:hypothetical protein
MPLGMLVKQRPGLPDKLRATFDTSAPHNHTDLTSYTIRQAVTFSREHLFEVIATALRIGPAIASSFDYSNSFESIRKRREDIRTNVYYWEEWYWYIAVHVYGQSESPGHADNLFQLPTEEMRAQFEILHAKLHPIFRNCDDTLILDPLDDLTTAEAGFALATSIAGKAGLTLQPTKTHFHVNPHTWNGFIFDFIKQTLGYSPSKIKAFSARIQLALNPASLTFKQGESFLGLCEHYVLADIWARVLIPSIRASILAAKKLPRTTKVSFSTTAVRDLVRLLDRLSSTNGEVLTTFQDHFRLHTPTATLFSDASGASAFNKDGVGGYGSSWHTFAAWSSITDTQDGTTLPWLLHKAYYSTGLIELLGLLMLLLAADKDPTLHKTTIRWKSDSAAAVGAWTNMRSPSLPCNEVLKRCQHRLSILRSHVQAVHVPRDQNTIADHLSHSDPALLFAQNAASRFVPTQRGLAKECGRLRSIFTDLAPTPLSDPETQAQSGPQ